MNIIQLNKIFNENPNIKRDFKLLSSKLPKINLKFRNTFCVTGKKIEYEDLSKVVVSKINGKLSIIPKIFSNDLQINEFSTELDYIGVYTVGMLELLHLGFNSLNTLSTMNVLDKLMNNDSTVKVNSLFDSTDEYVAEFNKSIVNHIRNKELLTSFSDIEKLFDCLSDSYNDNTKYTEIFNILFSLRTNYDDYNHGIILDFVNSLLAVWILDKRTYWQIFFDIMELIPCTFCGIFENFLEDKYKMVVKNKMLTGISKNNSIKTKDFSNSDEIYKFNTIRYKVPNKEIKTQGVCINKITDCRAFSIYMCLSLYYRLIYNYGYNVNKDYFISYNNDKIIEHIDSKLTYFLGNDFQYNVLVGNTTNKGIRMTCNNTLAHTEDDNVDYYRFNCKYITRDLYEEYILIANKYNIDIDKFDDTGINVHYSNVTQFLGGLAKLWYLSSVNSLISKNTKNEIDQLKNKIVELTGDVNLYKNKLNTTVQNYEQQTVEEISRLKQELQEAQETIKSKNDIIDNLVNKNKELNKFIVNIYDDDSIIETDQDTISIEDMIKEINEFNIILVGGRVELSSKLNELGWTNVSQIDRNNISTGFSTHGDFYIINTKFISHPLYYKIESVINPEYLINFNGTNPQKLVEVTYDFIMKFFNKN